MENFKQNVYPNEMVKMGQSRWGGHFLNALGNFHKEATKENMSKKKMMDAVKALLKMRKTTTKKYLQSLICPEKVRDAKIPAMIPLETVTFPLDDQMDFSAGVNGNFLLQWCPQNLLYDTSSTREFSLNNSSLLTGNTVITTGYNSIDYFARANNANFQVFRVVSAGVIITFQGSPLDVKGRFGGALDISPIVTNLPDTGLSDLATVDDKMWALKDVDVTDGIKIIYIPKDQNDVNFIKPGLTPQGNNLPCTLRIIVKGHGLSTEANSFLARFFKNIEAVAGPAFADLLKKVRDNYSDTNIFDLVRLVSDSNMIITNFKNQDEVDKLFKTSGNLARLVLEHPDVINAKPKDKNSVIAAVADELKKMSDSFPTSYS